MKAISIHVPEETYQELKSLAQRQGKPLAELIRQAMADCLDRDRRSGPSLLEIKPHRSGRSLKPSPG